MKKLLAQLAYALVVVGVVSATYVAGFGAAWMLGGSTQTGARLSSPTAAPAGAPVVLPETFRPLLETWDAISQDFYGRRTIDAQTLVRAAIKGMVDALGDPHTYYLTPSDSKIAEEDLQGSFEGIGATIEKRDNKLLVVAPIEGSPAERAGLRAGDNISQVNGRSTDPLTTTDAVALIRGPAGTVVHLTVIRQGEAAPLQMDITRARIDAATVRTRDLGAGLAYLRISSFSEPTSQELATVLRTLLASKPKGLVLDLRNNPGGYLTTSVEVVSQFLKDGVAVYEEDADGRRQAFPVRRGGIATDIPLVVLVNKGSASASEIVAGALQDAGRAKLIGEKTFGKGSVQTTRRLSDGSTIHVTIAHWLTPKGRQIHEVGLEPDIAVAITEQDVAAAKDSQLDRAIGYLTSGS